MQGVGIFTEITVLFKRLEVERSDFYMMAKYTLGNRKMECGTSPVFINPVRCECVEGLLAQIGGGGGGGGSGLQLSR